MIGPARRCRLVCTTTLGQLGAMQAGSIPFSAPAGKMLFSPGSPCQGLVLLSKGSIKVSMTGASGREVVLYRVAPGQICMQTFACLIDEASYSASGVAESGLDGELIPIPAFWARVAADADFRKMVFSAVARRFGEYQQLVEDVALTSFDARLARVLLRLADEQGRVMLTHDALAAETASGRAFVSRRLAQMEKMGLVTRHRGGLDIRDRDGLEEIASGE